MLRQEKRDGKTWGNKKVKCEASEGVLCSSYVHQQYFFAFNSPPLMKNWHLKSCVYLFSVSTWRMARLPAAAPWIPRPPPARVWSSTLTSLVITSAGSPSSTALTATMICRPSRCHETPPSPLNCKWKTYANTHSIHTLHLYSRAPQRPTLL